MMDMLAHLREINEAVLELVVFWRIRDLITPRLLHEVSQLDGDHGEMAPGDIIHMGMEILGEIKSRRRIRPFTNLAQVYRFQEKMDALYQQYVWRQEEARRLIEEARARRQEEQRVRRERAREKRSEMAKRPFPPPPIPGTEHIIPLTSREELKQEGRQQSNCVGSYSSRVLSGDTYIYRVLKPERATLSIVYRADGCWRRSQLKTKGNRAVRPETIRLVDSWLGAYRLSI